MIAAINFYDEMVMKVSEISNIVANDMLSTKLVTYILIPYEAPKNAFCFCWILPIMLRKFFEQVVVLTSSLIDIHMLHSEPSPSPFGEGRGGALHPLRHLYSE